MPRVVVIVFGNEPSVMSAADAVVAGAKRVRFTETTVRSVGASGASASRFRPLDDGVGDCDGMVFVTGSETGDYRGVLHRVGHMPSAGSLVMGLVGAAGSEAIASLVGVGGIIAGPVANVNEPSAAESLGEKVARVAGWVRHSLGHEADHAAHGHDHHHDAGHHHHHEHGRSHG